MNFKEHKKLRMEAGDKLHKGKWNKWTKTEFLENAQEEIIDCSNYLNKYDEVHGAFFNCEFLQVITLLPSIYNKLETMKKEVKK